MQVEMILGPTSLALQIEAIPLSGRRLLTFEPCKVASVYSAIGLVLTETGCRWCRQRSQGSNSEYGIRYITGFAGLVTVCLAACGICIL